jgi:hypothetical protein
MVGIAVFTHIETAWEAAPARIPGVTMIRKVSLAAVRPLMVAVTQIVAVSGVVPVFVALNGAIFPVPEAGKPIEGLSLIQEYVNPPKLVLNDIAVVVAVWQSTWSGFLKSGGGVVNTYNVFRAQRVVPPEVLQAV